jgi:hypothetical protein
MSAKKIPARKPKPDIADLLSATFTHPELPYKIWDVMADALCEMDSTFDKYANPAVMREVIAGHPTVSETE